jgi:GT2 family glycosyltransferase
MKNQKKCDIILPVCDQYEYAKACIESIITNTDTPYRLIVINNGSHPGIRTLLDGLEKRRDVETTIVRNKENIGWVKALNRGLELSDAPYVCFQNDDTIVTRGWLGKLIAILEERREFGLINPSWEDRPGEVYRCGKAPAWQPRKARVSIERYNEMLEERAGRRYIETDWCRGFCAVIKKAVVERIGTVDEIYGLAYFDDVDYSVTAIDAGFLCLKALNTYVYHERNATFFEVLKGNRWNELHEKNKRIYYKKWGRPLKVAVLMTDSLYRDTRSLDAIEETVVSMARKQHHIDIWTPCSVRDRFRHTNVRVRSAPGALFRIRAMIELVMNRRKRCEKRYDAIFSFDRWVQGSPPLYFVRGDDGDFGAFMRTTIDGIKEKTKESIDAQL